MRCDVCRFDSDGYTWGDLMGSLRAQYGRWTWTLEGLDGAVVRTRPEPDTWSAYEYASHVAKSFAVADEAVGRALTEDAPDIGDFDVDPEATGDITKLVSALTHHALSLHEQVALLSEAQRDRHFTIWGAPMTIRDGVELTVHEANHHLSDAGRVVARLGAGAPVQTGSVAGLFASGGGVPKLAIDEADVGYRGVAGDHQDSRVHHGRVWQALCLWSGEVIDTLAAEGHPVVAGGAGENVTVRGIDWSTLRPGTRIELGTGDDAVLAEITAWADPCHQIRANFSDGDETRIDHNQHPFSSRAYASVLRDGVIRAGDPVVVEPG